MTVAVRLVKIVPIASRGNPVRMTRLPTDVALTRILGPGSEQRSWASLLNPDDGGEPPPTRARQMTALYGTPRTNTSPHIPIPVVRPPSIRTIRLTPLPILILTLTPQPMVMIPQPRTYNPNLIPRYQPSHSTTMRGTPPRAPTYILLHPPTPPLGRRHRKHTLTSILRSSRGRL